MFINSCMYMTANNPVRLTFTAALTNFDSKLSDAPTIDLPLL